MAINFTLPRSIPWITQQVEPGVQARTLVDERFDAVALMVAGAKEEFDDAIASMNQSLSPIAVSDLGSAGIEIPDLGGDIPSFTGVFDKTFTETLDDFDAVYVEPGGKPDSSIAEWDDGELSLEPELIGKIAAWLTSGETAIPESLVTQIYNAAELQLDEKRAEAVAIEESKVAARGFEIPSGVADNKVIRIEREYAKASAELSAAIANKNMELTQANFHKAVEVAERYVAAARDYMARKNAAKIQLYSAAVDAWVKQVDAAVKVIDANVAAFNGRVEAYKAKAAAYKTEAEVFDSTVKAYTALVDGLKVKVDAVAEAVRLQVQVFQVESTVAIEEEKLRVTAQSANQTHAQKIANDQSSLHAQILASLLSSMHTQASISSSHGTGQDVSFSYNYGEHMSEGHSENMELKEK